MHDRESGILALAEIWFSFCGRRIVFLSLLLSMLLPPKRLIANVAGLEGRRP